MKKEEARQEVIQYWMEKAHEALQSARAEQLAGRLVFAINRAYYGCFYSASAVLLRE
ncbi:MAG: HEPN domain-containing protein [Thermodesulfobacteriota bacterium]|nr:HEPN domain-containing protein [Thermodesulfobacteriota bacterium]